MMACFVMAEEDHLVMEEGRVWAGLAFSFLSLSLSRYSSSTRPRGCWFCVGWRG